MPGNGYQTMSGTSMACPMVSGTTALLAERYAQLNQGREIRSDLLRSILANTATDIGRPGPDFQYGYGIMDAEKAAITLENGYYHYDSLAMGQVNEWEIPIPSACQGLRVMIAWIDPPAYKTPQWGSRVLINDLDLSLEVGGTTYLPWVCNGTKGHVEDNAARAVDTLNNMEQITLNQSELRGKQGVKVLVKGREISKGKQRYVLTWWYDEDTPRVGSPASGMALEPGKQAYLALENMPAPFAVEISYDGGATYRAIGRVEQSIGNILFRVPADAPVTERALVRVQGADGRLAVSAPFTIAPQPKGVKVTGAGCGLAGWKVEWERCEGATQGYAVLVGDPSTSQFTQIGQTDGVDKTEFTVPAEKLQGVERPVFSVASRAGNGYGKRAVGVLNTPSNPLVIKSASLPFSETFLRYPSIYFSPKAGANAEVLYRNQSVGDVPPGSSFVGLRCNRDLPTFDTSSYFSPTNADNMASLTLCELDRWAKEKLQSTARTRPDDRMEFCPAASVALR